MGTLPCFDMIRGTTIDYMHCVLLGVCRQLLKLWVKTKNKKEIWYIGKKILQVDDRLISIKPPEEIQRTPRRIETTLQYWKGCILWFNS